MSTSAVRLPPPARIALAAAAAVWLGYMFTPGSRLPADGGPAAAISYDGFYGQERGFRWSAGESAIRFAEPGPGVPVRVELELSGWRPPGAAGPQVVVRAGAASLSRRLDRRFETLALETVTEGVWSSDLLVAIRADTFSPGDHDRRELGVRVVEARLLPHSRFGLRRPPLRPLAWGVGLALAAYALLRALGSARALLAGYAAAAALLPALVLARPDAAAALGPAALVLAVLAGLARLLPRPAATALELARGTAAAAARAAGGLIGVAGVVTVAATVASVAAAQWARTTFELDLGAGRAGELARSFGPLDSAGGRSFRGAQRGALLDLRDLGGGTEWRLSLDVAVAPAPRELLVARAGDAEVRTTLGAGWTTVALRARAPLGWRSGLAVRFPDAQQHVGLRVAAVRVDRGRSLPSLRILLAATFSALLVAAIPLALGLPRVVGAAAGTAAAAALAGALGSDPVVATRFVIPFAGISACGALLACGAAGAHALVAARGAALPLAALIGPALGFVAWWSATAYPVYRGGHFTFHASIAQEIWDGRFLIYYLPYPGSMLSRQAQWGDLIFPHPCSFHTAVAPLAALGQPWFHALLKGALASWLAALATCAAMLARRSGGERAALYAGLLAALLPITYQLLGLGHLMTLFGVFATTLALTFLTLRLDRLHERGTFGGAVGLLALALLSYFAAVPFLLAILCGVLLLLHRRSPRGARRLLAAGLAAATIAFALYYANWAWPFLTESVPRLLSGSERGSSAGAASARLALQPGKLSYTFGSWLVPVLALCGLVGLARREDRPVLWPWAGLLVAFSGLDLFFNFLLKHHYFTTVPVAVGLALLLARLAERGRGGRLAAWAALAAVAWQGALLFRDTALGLIP